MQVTRHLLLSVLIGTCPAFPALGQDAAVLRGPVSAGAVHPAVALEQRIIGHVDALGITGEQEPPFRVAMQQVADVEAGEGAALTPEALLNRIVEIVANVLYPTQVAAFRERELLRLVTSH